MRLACEDRLDILELIARYGHYADEGYYERLGELFSVDAVFDATDMGLPLAEGLAAITSLWKKRELNPLAHHATNVVISEVDSQTANVLSKGIGVGYRGRVGSVTYRDVVRREREGWRFVRRVATLRRSEESSTK